MRFQILNVLAFGLTLVDASYPALPDCWAKHNFDADHTLERDVLVIGGGASGTFAAVKLKDQKKTVAVVERAGLLGGHVNTYTDPATGFPIDYGVQAYINNKQTQDFFGRFSIALNVTPSSPFPNVVADFSNGLVIPNATVLDTAALAGPIGQYLTTVATAFPFLAQGTYDLPNPVPADLLLPFGAFVAKYNLSQALPVIWTFAQGVGNLLETTTLNVLQNFGQSHILGLSSGYLYSPIGNQVVYDKAGAFLGSDVLYNSKVVATARSEDGVSAVVNTANGLVLIKAKKLLVTIPPTTSNLKPFNLDDSEKAVFGQWQNIPYYVGVLAKTGLPDLTSFVNINVSSQDTLPRTPFVWQIDTVGLPGYQTVKVIGEPTSSGSQKLVADAVTRLDAALKTSGGATEFVRWEEHDNLQLHVPAEAVAKGFYSNLYALQGKRSTWYTGNAWASDYSPLLWAFTEERILPNL